MQGNQDTFIRNLNDKDEAKGDNFIVRSVCDGFACAFGIHFS